MTPPQKPGRSKQDYQTPLELLAAVKAKLGIDEFYCDLAASRENAVANTYITKEIDALSVPWTMRDGWCWLNPPYANIAPWAAKAKWSAREHRARIAMLIPAAVGSNWWRDHVHMQCRAVFLNGRITFVGCEDPYPKDCALLLYDESDAFSSYDVWTWKPSRTTAPGASDAASAEILSAE